MSDAHTPDLEWVPEFVQCRGGQACVVGRTGGGRWAASFIDFSTGTVRVWRVSGLGEGMAVVARYVREVSAGRRPGVAHA